MPGASAAATFPSRGPRTAAEAREGLAALADPVDAANLARFFQTGPGGYGEGDVFLGIRVPALRAAVRAAAALPLPEALTLLDDAEHEHRLFALLLMVDRFRRAGAQRGSGRRRADGRARPAGVTESSAAGSAEGVAARRALHQAYLQALHRGRVNNWDLVDASAEWLIGEAVRDPLLELDARLVDELVADEDLWRRRAGILAGFAAIKAGDARPSLRAAEAVIADRRDLVQKASGWMLREVGKRVDRAQLLAFLDRNAGRMPRTMLSYATEHLDPGDRARYRSVPRA